MKLGILIGAIMWLVIIWAALAQEPGITLTWQLPENVSGTYIYAGTNSGSYSLRFTVPDRAETIHLTQSDGIRPDVVYHIVATAYDEHGAESAYSAEVTGQYEVAATPAIETIETRGGMWRQVHEIKDGIYKARWERAE